MPSYSCRRNYKKQSIVNNIYRSIFPVRTIATYLIRINLCQGLKHNMKLDEVLGISFSGTAPTKFVIHSEIF